MAKDNIPVEDDYSDLTVKQRALVDNYIVCRNITQAAKDAGYAPKSAYTTGPHDLKKPRVQKYYQKRIAEITAKSDDKIAFVLERLQEIASSNMLDYVNSDGSLKKLDKKTVNGRLIQSVKQTQYGTQITLQSAEKALELMGRYIGMWSDKLDVTTNGNDIQGITINYEEVSKIEPQAGSVGGTQS